MSDLCNDITGELIITVLHKTSSVFMVFFKLTIVLETFSINLNDYNKVLKSSVLLRNYMYLQLL